MSKYTSTREGFQRAMECSLSGPADESKAYVEATSEPSFYHIMNGQRLEFDQYVSGIKEWRGKVSEYKPTVHEFLRDGDQLAAHMDGTIKVDGADVHFESFMFAQVDKESGKMVWMVERSVWGAVGAPPEHGIN